MSGVDHDAFADENADVRHAILAVAVHGPEEHVAGLGFCAGEMLAEARVILRLRGARDGVVTGSADGILRESGAVVAAVGFALASSTSKDVVNAFLSFGRGYNVRTGAVRRRRGFGAIHTALDGAITRTSTGDESSLFATVTRVQADTRAGLGTASLFDTALYPIRVMRAVPGEVESLGRAAGGLLTSPFTIRCGA